MDEPYWPDIGPFYCQATFSRSFIACGTGLQVIENSFRVTERRLSQGTIEQVNYRVITAVCPKCDTRHTFEFRL